MQHVNYPRPVIPNYKNRFYSDSWSWGMLLYAPGLKVPRAWKLNLLFFPAAAAAAKSLQSCPTLYDPIDGSPPGSPVPGILQAKTLEWVAISFSNAWKWKVKVKSLSRVRLFATAWTAAHQAPPSMGLSRQEYWSGVPLEVTVYKIIEAGTSQVVQWLRLWAHNTGGLGSIPGQGTRFHMQQLKILYATTKTWHN